LYWNIKPATQIEIGDLAGYMSQASQGYYLWLIGYKRKLYIAARIIWEMHYGAIPEGIEIDHINGDSLNNKIENLRLANKIQQQYNRKISFNNKSGYKGVCWSKSNKKWQAQININDKRKSLGFFDSIEEAKETYNKVAKELYKEFYKEE